VEVERLYKKSLALDPAEFGTNAEYGEFLNRMGRSTESIDYFKRCVRLEPLDSSPHLWLGLAYNLSGNSDAAVITMKKARELSDQPVFYNSGLMVFAMEENDRALIDKYVALVLNMELLSNINRSDTRNINQVMYTLLDTPEQAGDELRLFLNDPAYRNPMNRSVIAVWASYFGEFELALQVSRETIGSDLGTIW
jgi:tetratricopeptide (TPR) repeat protein